MQKLVSIYIFHIHASNPSPHCDAKLPSSFCKGTETGPQHNKGGAQVRRARRRQGDGRPWRDGRTSVVTPHSQVLDACRGSGRPHTDPDPRTRLQILKLISCSCLKDFSDRDPISVLNNIGIRATCSRKYLLEREH